ncbi:MAG: protein kinase [Pegethrix bostrychoides GSE-TBD4-15B]|jgi:serine/threonine-protein kinase|uniref:non-specific serine/threonine protein kinase n=1 Tax=Pegethrix bostrychoides GSE-TBD4-15B TaxID=2839662 RepID=A0A951U824_9CYAN|nr:protein kinase [Pegethrix bostrychoides GSE-TBD4-15B]
MQPPISAGTILQNRYRMLSILGQGGFGRTYLAEDQGRFHEPCALKEFIPPQGNDYAFVKARELFQREAAVLYQISHPQIPQFRAIFEEDHRLFLVQDYVEGKTYRLLLNERKAQGRTFSDAEALQLLFQILPVLDHIHSKGIIHRDIAPDNIILRQRDQLPVLIDFGVVKEIVTRFHSPDTEMPTTVGKLGYAPSEQMQTGRAYPNSDLYSLAVTVVVLMSGREPQELYDDRNLVWTWQRWVPNIHPGIAAVLNRMLSYRPADRYAAVAEVAQALQAIIRGSAAPAAQFSAPAPSSPATVAPPTAAQLSAPAPTPAPIPASRPSPTPPPLSQMKTMAVGRHAEPTASYPPAGSRNSPNYNSANRSQPPRPAARPDPVISGSSDSLWDNPWAVLAIGLGLATVTGIAAWAIVSALLNSNQSPPAAVETPIPTPVVTQTPTPTPAPTLTPDAQPVEYSQQLNLTPTSESTRFEGSLQANESILYSFEASEGQTLTATLEGEGVLLSVLQPDRQPVDDQAQRVLSWKGSLPSSGDYAIRLSPVKGVTASDYRLKLSLDPAQVSPPSPEPSPSPSLEPELEIQRLSPEIDRETQISGQSSAQRMKRYLVDLRPGQILKAELLQGAVTLNVRYPDGRLVENAGGVVTWNGRIFEGGEYQLDVVATQPTEFLLNVAVQGPPQPGLPSAPGFEGNQPEN